MKSIAIILALMTLHGASAWAATDDELAISANPSLSVIARAPAFSLKDTKGRTVKLTDFKGQVVLVAFVFTSCPGVCPLISKQMATLQESLKSAKLFGKKASMLSVTVDPENDTAEVLANYARTFNADATGWRFLRETPERTKPVLKAYDEWTKLLPDKSIDHPARVYLIDKASNLREIYSLVFFNEKQALVDIEKLVSEQ